MRPIIVGIDFSDSSVNALEHALTIAKKAELDLTLLYVKRPESSKPPFVAGEEDQDTAIKAELDKLVEKYSPLLTGNKLSYKIRTGKVEKEIVNEAKENNAYLLVIGTHGASGFEEMWIGSNANKVVSASPCPVITIRGGINVSRNLTRIVMPIDSTLETRQKVPYTAIIAKIFDAEIMVALQYTSKVKTIRRIVDEYAEQSVKYLIEHKVKFKIEELETKDVVDDLINFAIKMDANLISIMASMEKSAKNLWLGSYAQQLVNHSPIPVLTVHGRELMMATTA